MSCGTPRRGSGPEDVPWWARRVTDAGLYGGYDLRVTDEELMEAVPADRFASTTEVAEALVPRIGNRRRRVRGAFTLELSWRLTLLADVGALRLMRFEDGTSWWAREYAPESLRYGILRRRTALLRRGEW